MRSKLIWNLNAGNTSLNADGIADALEAVGFDVEVAPTASLEELDAALENPLEAVIVAGGDGSVRQIVKRLRGRQVPIVILPMGTANNLAGSLGIRQAPMDLIAALERRVVRTLDLGVLRYEGGEDVFLEGAGVGLFAHTMNGYGEDNGKSMLRALNALTRTVVSPPVIHARFSTETEEVQAELSMLEVLNTPAIGPRLMLAPDADPSDGWLEVMTIEPAAGVGFINYVIGMMSSQLHALENVTLRRARRVELDFDGGALHFDGESLEVPAGRVEFWLEPDAFSVVVPAPSEADLALLENTESPEKLSSYAN
jgi:diacylglycerol kinase (ATP)